MQKSLLVFFLLNTLTSMAYKNSNFGYIPPDWYQLPEDKETDELENYNDKSHNLEKLSQTLENIVNANSNVLERVEDTHSKKWNLSYIRTSIALSSTGLIGVLSLKGMSAVKLYWRPLKKPEKKKKKTVTTISDEIILNNSFGTKEIKQAIQPVLQRALASGKIKNPKKFEKNLIKASEDFHFITSDLASLDQSSRWWVRALLLELYVSASGSLTPVTSLGTEIRIRLRWQRIQKATANNTLSLSTPTPLNIRKNNLTEFIYNLANDLEQSSEKAFEGSSFKPRYFRIGLGIGIKGNIVVVKAKTKALFHVMFTRNFKATKKKTKVKEKTSSHIWLVDEHQDKRIKYAKNKKIKYQENFLFNESAQLTKTTKNVIYKIKRNTFRKGLEKAYRISRFFIERAEKSPGRKWELFNIETQFEISLTGSLGLTSLSGLGATRIYFYKENT
jgi:hypothetical protein